MNEQVARQFLQCLAAKNVEQHTDGKMIRCSCPLARWRHKSGKDSKPSFALFYSDHEEPHFHCFSCESGSVPELLQLMEMHAHADDPALLPEYRFADAHEILAADELSPVQLGEYEEFATPTEKKFVAWPQEFVQSFMPALNHAIGAEYLLEPKDHLNQFGQKCRAVPQELVEYFDLRYDFQRGMIGFPYRSAGDLIAGMRGRSIMEQKHYDYTWKGVNNAKLIWFNEMALHLPGWVVVTEGQFDAIRVYQGGYKKVVANMTSKPSQFKADKLLYADGTILIPDNDDTGDMTVEKYKLFHQKHQHPFRVLKLPDSVKDADEAHPEYLRDRINEILNGL